MRLQLVPELTTDMDAPASLSRAVICMRGVYALAGSPRAVRPLRGEIRRFGVFPSGETPQVPADASRPATRASRILRVLNALASHHLRLESGRGRLDAATQRHASPVPCAQYSLLHFSPSPVRVRYGAVRGQPVSTTARRGGGAWRTSQSTLPQCSAKQACMRAARMRKKKHNIYTGALYTDGAPVASTSPRPSSSCPGLAV